MLLISDQKQEIPKFPKPPASVLSMFIYILTYINSIHSLVHCVLFIPFNMMSVSNTGGKLGFFMSSLQDFHFLTHTTSSFCANNQTDGFASSSDLLVQQMSARHIH